MSIGQVIKVVREERGLTQSQFAHELFVTQQALSRWEKGTAEPSIDMIRLISTRFEVPMARLMEMPDNGFAKVVPCRFTARKITAPNRMERETEIIATTAMKTAFFFRPMPIAMNWSPRVRR